MTKATVPVHLGMILDGNRRWAKQNKLKAVFGHKKGQENFDAIADHCWSRGVKYLSVWVWSTENWKRPKHEINYIMDLFKKTFTEKRDKLLSKGVKIVFSGRLTELTQDIQDMIKDLMEASKNYTKGVLNFCMNYGGKTEIVDAVKRIIKDKINPEQITSKLLSSYMYCPELPPVDFIIRTSGEKRHSGMMLWNSDYSEYYFMKKLWPDVTIKDIDIAFADYAARDRRFGGS